MLICRGRCNRREYVQVTRVRYRILRVTYCKQPVRPRVEREREREREKKDWMSLSRIFRHAYNERVDERCARYPASLIISNPASSVNLMRVAMDRRGKDLKPCYRARYEKPTLRLMIRTRIRRVSE